MSGLTSPAKYSNIASKTSRALMEIVIRRSSTWQLNLVCRWGIQLCTCTPPRRPLNTCPAWQCPAFSLVGQALLSVQCLLRKTHSVCQLIWTPYLGRFWEYLDSRCTPHIGHKWGSPKLPVPSSQSAPLDIWQTASSSGLMFQASLKGCCCWAVGVLREAELGWDKDLLPLEVAAACRC